MNARVEKGGKPRDKAIRIGDLDEYEPAILMQDASTYGGIGDPVMKINDLICFFCSRDVREGGCTT